MKHGKMTIGGEDRNWTGLFYE